MNFEIQTTSYFDTEAKRLAKRHRSFIDDLQDFQKSLLENPYLDIEALQKEGKLKVPVLNQIKLIQQMKKRLLNGSRFSFGFVSKLSSEHIAI